MSHSHTLRIATVKSEAEKEIFISLPWEIYAGAKHWVAPLKKDERKLLDSARHPFWQKAKGELFLAYRKEKNGEEKAVGRILAIVDDGYNENAKEKCGAWGFFECQNDLEAAHALFAAAADWLKAEGMEFMRGPLNPSTNYTCGMLVGGFELDPCIMMPWNHTYYPHLVESWHMYKEQDLFAYALSKETLKVPPSLQKQIDIIKDRNEFTWRNASKATMTEDIYCMLDIFQKSWAQNFAFTPMSLDEAKNHVQGLKSVLDPRFFVLFYHKGEPAGGMLALPDMNPLLKRLNGKLGLMTPWHYWCARKEIRGTYRMVLFGVLEKYRLMGLPLLLLQYMMEQSEEYEYFSSLEGSWTLEDNVAVNDMMEDFGGQMTKRYRIYRKELIEPCL